MRIVTALACLGLGLHSAAFGQTGPPVLSPLTLTLTGSGSFSPNLDQHLLRIGATYRITARPGAGFVFSNWTGGVDSSSPQLAFIMRSNLVLQANFVPNPFLASKGKYAGLFQEPGGAGLDSSGFLTLTLTDRGSFSARLQMASRSYSFHGQFSAGGAFSSSIPRRGLSPLVVQLQLDLVGGAQLTGTIDDELFMAAVTAQRAVYSRTAPAPQSGKRFNVVISPAGNSPLQPGGHGFGSLTVDVAGNIRFAGTLGDGTKVSQGTFVSKTGLWPLFATLYGGRELIFGELAFVAEPLSDLSGSVYWFRLPQATARMYPEGFALTNGVEAVGSAYSFTRGVPLMTLPNGGVLALAGGGLAQTVTNTFTLDNANRVTGTNRLSISITPATGLFHGRAINPLTGRPVTVGGALLLKQNAGFGQFSGTNQTGAAYFGPPEFPPGPPLPVVDFRADPTNGSAPLSVSFINQSQWATSYLWDFGDGSQSTLENPSKTYTDAGAYSVTLTAVGAGGTNVRARANYIVVTNAPPPLPPVADFQADPTNGPAPLTVSFINLSQRATNYLWDFGDGSQSGPQSPSKTYTNAGVYTVTLTVLGAGGSDVRTRPNYIVVTNRPAGADLPSRVLNLTNWKLTLPVDTPHTGSPDEIKQPELDRYQDTNYFCVNESKDGVLFTAPCGGATTSGSSYPRSELREMTNNGRDQMSWSTTNGSHTMEIKQAITHLPVVKPHVVAGQIHDANDDVLVFRLEGAKLFIDENGNGGPVLTTNYRLGDVFTARFVARLGGVDCYYNGQYVYTHPVNASGCYFKAGCYTQSNTNRGDATTAYGQVVIYSVSVTHQ